MKINVAIIFGGNSVEHEISILSSIQVSYAIDKSKYDVSYIYITKDNRFLVGPNFDNIETFKKNEFKGYEVTFYKKKNELRLKGIGYVPRKYLKKIDVVLPIVHGKNVEDGVLAGFFKLFNVPYASCDVLAASISQNKIVTKKVLEQYKVDVVTGYSFTSKEFSDDVFKVLEDCNNLGYPLIIKPATLGSSIGIKIANNHDELVDSINYALKYDEYILVEKKLEKFREFNQAILGDVEEYKLSNIEEVKNSGTWLTFSDKYTSNDSIRDLSVVLSDELKNKIEETSKKVLKALNTKGVVRIDYLYDIESNMLYVNEVNTIPGSLGFYLFENALSFTELIDTLIRRAVKNHYINNLKINTFNSNVLTQNNLKKQKK